MLGWCPRVRIVRNYLTNWYYLHGADLGVIHLHERRGWKGRGSLTVGLREEDNVAPLAKFRGPQCKSVPPFPEDGHQHLSCQHVAHVAKSLHFVDKLSHVDEIPQMTWICQIVLNDNNLYLSCPQRLHRASQRPDVVPFDIDFQQEDIIDVVSSQVIIDRRDVCHTQQFTLFLIGA